MRKQLLLQKRLTTSSNLNRYEKIFDGSAAVNV